MVDTHAHIEMCEDTPEEIVARAAEAGVDKILTIGLTEETFDVSLAIADAHPGVFAAVGCHPFGVQTTSVPSAVRPTVPTGCTTTGAAMVAAEGSTSSPSGAYVPAGSDSAT